METSSARKQITSTMKALQRLAANDAYVAPRVQKLAVAGLHILHDADQLSASLTASDFTSNLQRFNRYQQIMKTGLSITDDLLQLIQYTEAQLNRTKLGEVRLAAALKLTVLAGFTLAVVGTGLIFFVFAKKTRRRIGFLISQSLLLKKLEVSEQPLGGNDELAYLDSVFREVCQKLRLILEQHQMIIQMLAHDIRSPIMATKVSVEIFEEILSTDEHTANTCASVSAACDHILTVVNDFLLMEKLECKMESIKISEFNAAESLEASIDSVSTTARNKDIRIVSVSEGAALISADEEKLFQALCHLLLNAIKAAPKGSVVTVKHSQDRFFDLIQVHDTGPAVSTDSSVDVFGKFSLAGRGAPAPTSNLGLYICKKLIELQDGNITVLSDSIAGTTFSIAIPKKCSRPPQVQEAGRLPSQDIANQSLWYKATHPGLICNGLILLLVSIAVQGVWLFWMDQNIDHSERLQMQRHKQAVLVSAVSRLWLDAYRAESFAAFFLVTRRPQYRDKVIVEVSALEGIVSSLAGGTATLAPQELRQWNETKGFIKHEISQLKLRIDSVNLNSIADEIGAIPIMIDRAASLNSKLARLVTAESRVLADMGDAEESFHSEVQSKLSLAMLGNLLIYLTLWSYFTQIVAKRLRRLTENARRLPLREKLIPPLTGEDEFALLDQLLQESAAALEVASRERSQLLDMLAREIREPLLSIENALSRLEGYVSLDSNVPPRALQNLLAARGNAGRILGLTNDLLLLDSLQQGKMELNLSNCSLVDLVDQAILTAACLGETKHIPIEKEVMIGTCYADEQRIVQVLTNLLTNSIKFSKPGSPVKVFASHASSATTFTVEDNGPGMNEETVEKIFNKFVQGNDSKNQGFGLGLAICKLIVHSHCGQIGVESEPGKGTKFWFSIPRSLSTEKPHSH